MITFELTKQGDQLEIHLDEDGLLLLKRHLDSLAREGHIHLKTPAWGGDELVEKPQGDGHVILNHVKLMLWNKDLQTS